MKQQNNLSVAIGVLAGLVVSAGIWFLSGPGLRFRMGGLLLSCVGYLLLLIWMWRSRDSSRIWIPFVCLILSSISLSFGILIFVLG